MFFCLLLFVFVLFCTDSLLLDVFNDGARRPEQDGRAPKLELADARQKVVERQFVGIAGLGVKNPGK